MNLVSRITSLLPAALRCALSFQAFIFALSAAAAVAAFAKNSAHLDGSFVLSALGLIAIAAALLFLAANVRRADLSGNAIVPIVGNDRRAVSQP